MKNGLSVVSRATLYLMRGLRKMRNLCFGAVRGSVIPERRRVPAPLA
jgi:hypothetical protein